MIREMFLTSLVVLTAMMLIIACDEANPQEDIPAILSLADEEGYHPTLRDISIVLEAEGAIEIEYWSGDKSPLIVTSDKAKEHEITLPRLAQGRSYDVRATVIVDDVRSESSYEGSFETDSLPISLSSVKVDFEGEQSFELFASTYYTLLDSGFIGLIVWDEDGDIVWWWEEPNSISAFDRFPNGNFAFLVRREGLKIVSPLTGIIATQASPSQAFGFHHDLEITGDGTILVLGKKFTQTNVGEIVSPNIWEWDPAAQTVEEVWVAADWLDPEIMRGERSNPDDWWHSNSLNLGPRDNILVSLRTTDQVVSIHSDFNGIEWTLGGPASTFNLDDPFYAQHEATEYADNQILLFDNHLVYVDGDYTLPEGASTSRVVLIELDTDTGIAQTVWSFEPPDPIMCRAKNSTFRLSNGNSIATFTESRYRPSAAYEIDSQGQQLWSISYPEGWMVFGNAISNIAGER